jgi:hypothetical protein
MGSLGPSGEWHHIGWAERSGVGKAEVEVVENSGRQPGGATSGLSCSGKARGDEGRAAATLLAGGYMVISGPLRLLS